MSRYIELDKLVVSKRVWKNVKTYKVMFPHVIAARHLTQQGKKVEEGETVDFVYVNADHDNPFRRVLPTTMICDNYSYYDRKKYGNMVLDAAETVLSTFGFSKQRFGLALRTKRFVGLYYWVEGGNKI